MISLPSGTRIWLVAGVTDMRKSFNGLGELVQHVLDENPFFGHLFIFRGRKGYTVKILWADADGLCLFTKRLEEGQFIWPQTADEPHVFTWGSSSVATAGRDRDIFQLSLHALFMQTRPLPFTP